MKKNKLSFVSIIIVSLLLINGCTQQPDINISDALTKSEELLRQSDMVETTAVAFDGKSDVKCRLMVKKHPTEEEAIVLFNQILDSVVNHSNNLNIWDYYNGFFDIKSYDNNVIYEATKLIGEDLEVVYK